MLGGNAFKNKIERKQFELISNRPIPFLNNFLFILKSIQNTTDFLSNAKKN